MKNKFARWYEKNEYLKAFMNLLQEMPIDKQCAIAVEMIVKASNYSDRDYSKIIADVADFNPRKYKRWYDKNPNIHIAIETLRDLPDEKKEEIIQEFTNEILNSYSDKYSQFEDTI